MKYILFLVIFTSTFSYSQKIRIIDYTLSECEDNNQCTVQPRIIYESYINDTLEVAFNIIENCEGIYDLKTEYRNDTLFINYESGRFDTTYFKDGQEVFEISVGECDCCFEFTLKLKNKKPSNYILDGKTMYLFENKYKLFDIYYKVVNGDTINLIDKYGRKQGKWYSQNTNLFKSYRIWKDNIPIYYISEDYYNTGEIRSKQITELRDRYIEYFKDGSIKKDSFLMNKY